MKQTEIGFKHTYTTNNGYADYTVTEEVIGVFYKAGLGTTTYSNSEWKDINEVKEEELEKFYQIIRQSSSKNSSSISIVTLNNEEWFEQFKKK